MLNSVTHSADRRWVCHAIETLEADRQRTADTHLTKLALRAFPEIDIYLKDESVHPTGSLKHRLARSLFLHAICNGDIHENTHVIEASSGSTAIAEAFFARMLGLRFTAVVPESTAPAKIAEIEKAGGRVHFAPTGADICTVAAELAGGSDAHFMDQFTYAERATDWRGNNNIAESIFTQMRLEPYPIPRWIVVGAGTGGTSATIGRYIRYRPELASVKLCVVDPEGSIFWRLYCGADTSDACPSLVEGIGRTRPVASFVPRVIDRMIKVADEASIAAMRWLAVQTGRRFGPSTGTNVLGVLTLAGELRQAGERGSIVTLACDPGDRYAATVYDDAWLSAQTIEIAPWMEMFEGFGSSGSGRGSADPSQACATMARADMVVDVPDCGRL